jgi:septum formation protein
MNFKLFLASNSPRRQDLLKQMGFSFEIIKAECDETYPQDLDAGDVALYVASKKMQAVDFSKLHDDALVITCDTVVINDDEIFGKPKSKEEAVEMLKKLSGRTHNVVSGVCVCSKSTQKKFSDTTLVSFAEMSDEEIQHYVDNYPVYDKAGAYAIQDWIGLTKIERIEGSYYNVMGFPSTKVYDVFSTFSF